MNHDVWSLICVTGLAGWVISALLLAFRAFPVQGQFVTRAALKWGVTLAISYMIWIIGLLNA